MKIMLATASVLTAAALCACGGGASGHSKAWQDGYDAGLKGGSEAAGQAVTVDFYCGGLSASYQGNDNDRKDYVAGCTEGFQKGQSQASSTTTTTP